MGDYVGSHAGAVESANVSDAAEPTEEEVSDFMLMSTAPEEGGSVEMGSGGLIRSFGM